MMWWDGIGKHTLTDHKGGFPRIHQTLQIWTNNGFLLTHMSHIHSAHTDTEWPHKYCLLCLTEERSSYWCGTNQGWVNHDHFCVHCPFKSSCRLSEAVVFWFLCGSGSLFLFIYLYSGSLSCSVLYSGSVSCTSSVCTVYLMQRPTFLLVCLPELIASVKAIHFFMQDISL